MQSTAGRPADPHKLQGAGRRDNPRIPGGDLCGGRERPRPAIPQPRLAAGILRGLAAGHKVTSMEGVDIANSPLQGDT